jgi:hypothetical protein
MKAQSLLCLVLLALVSLAGCQSDKATGLAKGANQPDSTASSDVYPNRD